MKDRLILVLYLLGLIVFTSIHDVRLLAGALAVISLLAGADLLPLARRTLLSILLFNSVVTVAYVAASLVSGDFSPYYVLLVNLRVFLITLTTFLFASRVNLFNALGFSPSLSYLLALSYSQLQTFRRLLADFRLARMSRSVSRPSLGERYQQGAVAVTCFLDKAESDTAEVAMAMRSRGFFMAPEPPTTKMAGDIDK